MTTGTGARAEPESATGFFHPALFYRGETGFVHGVSGFLQEALERKEPVFVAVPGAHLALLQEHLGPAGEDITWADMSVVGRNPGRILSALQEFADRHPGRRASLVGEPIWDGRTPAEMREATRHEALINLAFTGRTASILCPYDITALPGEVIADAHRTHPVLVADEGQRASDHYTDPLRVSADCDLPLPPPPASAQVLPFAKEDLGRVRGRAEQWARDIGMSVSRRTDLLLAVGEATTNSVRHGGGHGTVRMWTAGATAFVETEDSGRFPDALTGRRRPDPLSATGGRGVWLMHELCDLVEIRQLPGTLVVRLSMDIS